MKQAEDDAVEKNIRRTVGLGALRKIGKIVAEEQRLEAEKKRVVRWFARYGWVILLAAALLLAFLMSGI